ncbi:MAG: hypothetical protein SNJ77_11025 [Cytophagales bacterium]
MIRVLFHDNQINLQGTSVAMYDYAHFNETILNNKSFIVTPKSGNHDLKALDKFEKRFGSIFFYNTLQELQEYCESIEATHFYAIKFGKNDGLLLDRVKNCVHVVFKVFEPHGQVYAYVSEWLANHLTNGKCDFVPHIVHLPNTIENLRNDLGIPSNAVVFGRYGGYISFDIFYAKRLVLEIAYKRKNIYFVFMNTENFFEKKRFHKLKILNWFYSTFYFRIKPLNVIFLEGTSDLLEKSKFINTCDAMLHCRMDGETFGIACGEFSIMNKPVITYDGKRCSERSHLQILGEKGIYFRNKSMLKRILLNFKPSPDENYDVYSKDFNPETVMMKFKKIFLD